MNLKWMIYKSAGRRLSKYRRNWNALYKRPLTDTFACIIIQLSPITANYISCTYLLITNTVILVPERKTSALLGGRANRLAEITVPFLVLRQKIRSLLAFAGAASIVELLIWRADDVHWAYTFLLLARAWFFVPCGRNHALRSATADAFGLLLAPTLLLRAWLVDWKRIVDQSVNTST